MARKCVITGKSRIWKFSFSRDECEPSQMGCQSSKGSNFGEWKPKRVYVFCTRAKIREGSARITNRDIANP